MSGPVAISVISALTWATVGMNLSMDQASSSIPHQMQISTEQFKLTQSRGFALELISNGKVKHLAIPRDWLIPPDEERSEEDI